MKCLVTGAAGFIGSSLALRLIKRGDDVSVIDNLSTGRREFLQELKDKGATVYVQDYGDAHSLGYVRTKGYDTVFHVGAVPRVVYSIERPAQTHANNVHQTLRLLEACRGNVGRVVFSSSSAVAGDVTQFPTDENKKCTPKSPYAMQKYTIEHYLRMFNELYNLDSICLRYFNVYGPRQYGDSPYSTVISAWCQAISDGRPLRLDGDGEQSRDFCFIDNVVEANILASLSLKTFAGDAFNIAHGDCHSVNEVLSMFKERVPNIVVNSAPARQGDVFMTHADITKARNILNYEPSVKFRDGLEKTWDWWNI